MRYYRLPTVEELHKVFNYENGKPKVDGFTFDGYWSSTTRATCMNDAWIVRFYDGYTYGNDKSYPYCVRCVKKCEDGSLEWSEATKKKMTWDKANEYCKRMNDGE